MSDILYINGETIDVEKKFDSCTIEGLEETTSSVGTRTILIPVGGGGGAGIEMSTEEFLESEIKFPITMEVTDARTSNPYGDAEFLYYVASNGTQTHEETISEECYVMVIANANGEPGSSYPGNSSISVTGSYDTIIYPAQISDLTNCKLGVYKIKGSTIISATSKVTYSYFTSFLAFIKIPITWKIGSEMIYGATGGDNQTITPPSGSLNPNKIYIGLATASCRYENSVNAVCSISVKYPEYDEDLYTYLWAQTVYGSNRGRGDLLLILGKGNVVSTLSAYSYDHALSLLRVISFT